MDEIDCLKSFTFEGDSNTAKIIPKQTTTLSLGAQASAGDSPFLSVTTTLAPRINRVSVVDTRPFDAAKCNGLRNIRQ